MKRRIRFIINPISGVGSKGNLPSLIHEHLDHEKFDYDIALTEYRKHGKEIAFQSSLEGIDIVCAVGGDGSVHEVGTSLIGTKTALAIIPAGSGNGLARHLNIPLNIEEAIRYINDSEIQQMDTIFANDKPFLNAGGFGFDAVIAKKFDEIPTRGFKSYAKLVFKEFLNYKPVHVVIEINGLSFEREVLLCTIANASEFGNGFCISPDSQIQDGIAELVIVKPFTKVKAPRLLYQFFKKQINNSPHVEMFTFKKATIQLQEHIAHFDGEPFTVRNALNIEVIPKSLNILVNKN